jgi:hypothetical protein
MSEDVRYPPIPIIPNCKWGLSSPVVAGKPVDCMESVRTGGPLSTALICGVELLLDTKEGTLLEGSEVVCEDMSSGLAC